MILLILKYMGNWLIWPLKQIVLKTKQTQGMWKAHCTFCYKSKRFIIALNSGKLTCPLTDEYQFLFNGPSWYVHRRFLKMKTNLLM